jgi:hypothetical protein
LSECIDNANRQEKQEKETGRAHARGVPGCPARILAAARRFLAAFTDRFLAAPAQRGLANVACST